MKRGNTRKIKKFLDGLEIYSEILLYLLVFGVFFNIIVMIFTFDFYEGFLRIGINLMVYLIFFGIIEIIKWTRVRLGIKGIYK